MKMKLIILAILVLFCIVESRTRKSKNVANKQFFAASYARPAYAPFAPYSPYGYGYPASAWGYRSYWPGFRWGWLNSISAYPSAYIMSNKKSCKSVCKQVFPECEKITTKMNKKGKLQCNCKEAKEKGIVDKYCWTPKACVKANESGCDSIKAALDEKKKEKPAKEEKTSKEDKDTKEDEEEPKKKSKKSKSKKDSPENEPMDRRRK